MRNRGGRFECLRLRPHDHIGWVFDGRQEFAELARRFLLEGVVRGEKLMYVAADPDPADLLELADSESLQVATVAEVYGSSGIVNASSQKATFAAALSEALSDGYTGIRVAADNSTLVADEERLTAWMTWELVADSFISDNPITGLCAFDRERVDIDRLRHVATLHPLYPAARPVPQYRLFVDAGDLWVEGEIDTFAVSQLKLALGALRPNAGIRIDLCSAHLRGRGVLDALGLLATEDDSVVVTIAGESSAIDQLAAEDFFASERVVLEDTQRATSPPSAAMA